MEKLEKESLEGFIGLIKEVNPITNSTFFGEEGMFGEKDGYAVTIKIQGDETEFTQWFSKPGVRGFKQSNLYKFYTKYKSEPKKGLEVHCEIDENGFFRVTI